MQIFEVFGDLVFRDNNVRERLTQIHATVERARQNFAGLGQNMQMIGGSMTQFGSTMMNSVTKPLMQLIPMGIEYNMELENQLTSFETMMGSAKKAKQFMADISTMAAKTPYETQHLTNVSKTLMGFGVAQDKVLPIMSKLGDVAMGNAQRFNSLGLVMGQVSAAGKLQGGDLIQMINAGWNPLQEMVKMTGKDYKYFREQMSKGNISFKEVSKALDHATSKGGMFYQGMIKGSATLSGRISTLKDNFMIVLGKATKPLFDFLSAKVVPVISDLVAGFDTLSPSIKSAIFIVGGLVAGIGPLLMVMGGLVTVAGAVTAAIGTIGAPVIAVAAGIGVFFAQATILIGGLTALAYKTGVLEWAFNKLKAAIGIVANIFKGDFNKAITLLKNQFGITDKQAQWFTATFKTLRKNVLNAIDTIKSIGKAISAIFSGKSQDLINLLIKKFGYSKKEAENFAKIIWDLRDKFIKFGQRLENLAVNVFSKFISVVSRASKFLYEHRTQIMKIIEFVVRFTNKLLEVIRIVYKVMEVIGKFGNYGLKIFSNFAVTATKHIMKFANFFIDKISGLSKFLNPIAKGFNTIASAVKNVINKISQISFPKPPSWLPGFAKGVKNFSGGYAIVGEQGAEIVKLPKGADVIPNNQLKTFAAREFNEVKPNLMSNSGVNNTNIYMTNYISKEVDINKFFTMFEKVLKSRGVNYRNA